MPLASNFFLLPIDSMYVYYCTYNVLRCTLLYNVLRCTLLYNVLCCTLLYNVLRCTLLYNILRCTLQYSVLRCTGFYSRYPTSEMRTPGQNWISAPRLPLSAVIHSSQPVAGATHAPLIGQPAYIFT